MRFARHRAVLIMALGVAGSTATVARAQEPVEGGVAVSAPSLAPPEAQPVQPAPQQVEPQLAGPQPAGPQPMGPQPVGPQPAPAPGPAVQAPGGFDLGGRQVDPLPPPPPPVDPARIRMDPWRGRFWLAPRLLITGPIGGEKPARPTLLTIGGGLDFGIRINNRFGIGTGISGQTHTSIRTTVPGTVDKTIRNGSALFYDVAFVRLYFLKKRFQPLIEAGGGLARINMPLGERLFGAQVRAAVGFDAWVTSQVTLGFTTVYRMIALHLPQDGITPPHWSIGHAMQGALQLGLHW